MTAPKKHRYAEGTKTTIKTSRDEAERIIHSYGGDMVSIGYAAPDIQRIGFRYMGRMVSFDVVHPSKEEAVEALRKRVAYRYTEPPNYTVEAWIVSEVMRRWRVLILRLKTKLEIVEEDSSLFNEEFAFHMMLPSGVPASQEIMALLEGGR